MTSTTNRRQQPIQRPKGTQDIFLDKVALWHAVERTATQLLESAGYSEIRTPVFESTELFKRSVGEDTDIVNKEMYTFEKGDRSLTLRPEGTAGVVRAFIEQGLHRQPKPLKLFYSAPMFRYERPQAGRQRQFHQFGVEVFGADSPAADAEVIQLAMRLFERLGLPNLVLEINNIGDSASRQQFRESFCQLIEPVLLEFCDTCQTRFHTNPFRMLDCKNSACQEHYSEPTVARFLASEWTSEASQKHYTQVTTILDYLKIPYQRNHRLVRGLDYYNATVFEITSTHLGAQNTVCGGGRYDSLVEQLGGPSTPAVGWALGMERLVSLVEDCALPALDYYIVTDQHASALALADQLRQQGKSVEVDLTARAFGKQLATANKRHAHSAIILGEAEASSGQLQIKFLSSGQQIEQSRDDLLKSCKLPEA